MNNRIKTIFYADDDEDDHLIFSLALKEIHPAATLHSFYSCIEIINYLKEDREPKPDIIFLDQNINGNQDNECLSEIRHLGAFSQVPVIMYTTGSRPGVAQQAMELGAHKYILKPVLHKEIEQNLASVFAEMNAA
jgi:DNA-binding NarL/FixJ family response regulator